MPTPELTRDGSVVLETFVAPDRALARAGDRRRSAAALALATAASLAFAAVAAPRLDVRLAVASRLDRDPGAAELTPHQREEAVVQARKIAVVGTWAGGALAPVSWALAAALLLWMGFRVAGAAPGFRPTLAVAAHALLPVWLADLLALPALLARGTVTPEELGRLVPSSAAALLPARVPPQLAAAASALDVFLLWALALAVAGMARVAGTSRARSAAVVLALFAAFVALRVFLAAPGARP